MSSRVGAAVGGLTLPQTGFEVVGSFCDETSCVIAARGWGSITLPA